MKLLRWLSPRAGAWIFLSLAVAAQAAPPANDHLVIRTLSTDAASVSAGDVLVRIDIPSNASSSDVNVALNGPDVTATFLRASSNALVGTA